MQEFSLLFCYAIGLNTGGTNQAVLKTTAVWVLCEVLVSVRLCSES